MKYEEEEMEGLGAVGAVEGAQTKQDLYKKSLSQLFGKARK